jgi:hypothetical protein
VNTLHKGDDDDNDVVDYDEGNNNSDNNSHLKYADFKEKLVRKWQMKTAYIIPLILTTTGIIPNTLHESLKLLNFRAAVYILKQKAVVTNTWGIVRGICWQISE